MKTSTPALSPVRRNGGKLRIAAEISAKNHNNDNCQRAVWPDESRRDAATGASRMRKTGKVRKARGIMAVLPGSDETRNFLTLPKLSVKMIVIVKNK